MSEKIKNMFFCFFCHIWELTTLFGCDWYLLSTSYTCRVHFIHINGVLHTLYAVDGHKDATPTCMAMARVMVQLCFTSGNWPHCSVVIGTSYPLHTHVRSTSYIYKVFGILYMLWIVKWMPLHPVSISPGLGCVSHLGTHHTIRLWLVPPIHFIHMSGPLLTCKWCFAYFICSGWS